MKPPSRIFTGDRALFALLLVVVAWLPWPLGSNRPWAWALAEVAVFAALGLGLLASRGVRYGFRRTVRDHRLVLLLFGIWLGYQGLQTVDLGPFWLPLVAPATAEVYSSTAALTGSRAYSIAFDHGAVYDELLKHLLYLCLFLMVLMLARTRKRLVWLGGVIVGTGLAQAVYGLTGYFAYDAPLVAGSFVNKNHFAAFVVMAFLTGLGLLFPVLGKGGPPPRGASQSLRRGIEVMMGWQALLLVALVVLVAALLLSQSRGGLGAMLGAVVLTTGAGVVLRDEGQSAHRILGTVLLVAGAAAAWLGTGSLVERLGLASEQGVERLLLWSFTLDVIGDYPWFGVGADNYAWVITAYRGFLDRAVAVTHAHNDYLELMAEQGLVGSTLAGLPIFLILGAMVDGYRKRHDRLLLGMLFGSLAAATAFLLHAVVEFNFQIPSNAGLFFVILGMGLAAAGVRGLRTGSGDDGNAMNGT